MSIARCVSCDEKGRQRLSNERGEERVRVHSAQPQRRQQVARSTAGQSPGPAQKTARPRRQPQRTQRAARTLDKRQCACRRVDLRLDRPTHDETLQRRLDRVDRPHKHPRRLRHVVDTVRVDVVRVALLPDRLNRRRQRLPNVQVVRKYRCASGPRRRPQAARPPRR